MPQEDGRGRRDRAAPAGLSAGAGGRSGPGQEWVRVGCPTARRQRRPPRRWQLRRGKSRSSSFLSCHGREPRGMMFGNKSGCSKSFVARPLSPGPDGSAPDGFHRGEGEPPGLGRLDRAAPVPRTGHRDGGRGDRSASATGLSDRFCAREGRTRCPWRDPPMRWAQPIVRGGGARFRRGTALPRRGRPPRPLRSCRPACPPSRLPPSGGARVPAHCARPTRQWPKGSAIPARRRRDRRKFPPRRGLLHPVPLVQAPPP
jgi:hypothetical protein